LTSLSGTCGKLVPALEGKVSDYQLRVPFLCQQLSLTLGVPANVQIELNGQQLADGSAWTSGLLALGDTPVSITLTSQYGVSNKYALLVQRNGGQEAYIKAANANAADNFGFGVAIDGDTLVAGAPKEDGAALAANGTPSSSSVTDSGAAYTFTRSGTQWVQEAYLKPQAPVAAEYFGNSVALVGELLAVGAMGNDPIERSTSVTRDGAVYLFARSAGAWTQSARLIADDQAGGNSFGFSVVLTPDLLFVGAPYESASATRSGAVYVFGRDSNGWHQKAKLKAARPIAGACFGSGLSFDADTLVVGSFMDGSKALNAGSAYVFVRAGDQWQEQQKLEATTPAARDTFGWSSAIHRDTIVVGAPAWGHLLLTPPGKAYVFQRAGQRWEQKSVLQATLPRDSDYFSSTLHLSATALVLGANGDNSGSAGFQANYDDNSAAYSGAIYVYARKELDFALTTYIKASRPAASASFGVALSVSGDTIAAGAAFDGVEAKGINPSATGGVLFDSGALHVLR
jgi:hypothetical protein